VVVDDPLGPLAGVVSVLPGGSLLDPGRLPFRVQVATLWTNSYFVATIGGTTPEAVKQYVENQRNV